MLTDPTILPAVEQLRLLHRREISSVELLELHLERVRAWPELNAVVAVDEELATREAARVDEARTKGHPLGRLAGLPITIKDGWEVAGLVGTDGDPGLAGHVSPEDAPVCATLRREGAVLFGKSNVPLHCADAQTYNEVYGTTANPWDTTRSPGGSSGGAAAALAACQTPLELGSDIAGSIRLPASWCGVYGLKTTFGLLPGTGHVPGTRRTAKDMAVPGPMARTAPDLAFLLEVLLGGDSSTEAGNLEDFTGVSWIGTGFETDDSVLAALRPVVRTLAEAGLRVTDGAPPFDVDELRLSFYLLLSATTGPDLDDAAFAAVQRELADPSLSYIERASREGIVLEHRTWLREHERRAWFRDQIERLLPDERHVVLCPTVNLTAQPHDHSEAAQHRVVTVNGGSRNFYSVCDWNAIGSYTYLPALSIPVGTAANGLPVGLQVIGRRGADSALAAFACAVEEVLGPPPLPPRATRRGGG